MRRALADEMRKRGIDLRFRVDVRAIEKQSGGLRLALTDGSTLETDAVLYATGRVPNTRGLGLADAGVATGEGGVTKAQLDRTIGIHPTSAEEFVTLREAVA